MTEQDRDVVIFDCEQADIRYRGQHVRLGSQQARCLTLLMSQPGRVFTCQEFIRYCWHPQGASVTTTSVRQALFRLRRALNEAGLEKNILQTIPGHGYSLPDGIIRMTGQPQDTLSHAQICPPDMSPKVPAEGRRWPRLLALAAMGAVLLGGGGALRLSLLVSGLHWTPAGQQEGLNWFTREEITLTPALQSRIRYWLAQPQAELADRRYIYISRSGPHRLSFLACSVPVRQAGSRCITVTIVGQERGL